LGLLAAAIFCSGARGPLIALLAALSLVIVLFYAKRVSSLARMAAIGFVVMLVVLESAAIAHSWSVERLSHFLHREWGLSEQIRAEAITLSMPYIASNPAGIGWGAFPDRVRLPLPSMDVDPGERNWYLRYPHNILIEVILEGGWLLGAFLVALWLVALRRAYLFAARSRLMEGKALFGLLIFYIINAMVSGELDERFLFALLALALACRTLAIPGAGQRDEQVTYPPSGHFDQPRLVGPSCR
jgi:hypothetical protein